MSHGEAVRARQQAEEVQQLVQSAQEHLCVCFDTDGAHLVSSLCCTLLPIEFNYTNKVSRDPALR